MNSGIHHKNEKVSYHVRSFSIQLMRVHNDNSRVDLDSKQTRLSFVCRNNGQKRMMGGIILTLETRVDGVLFFFV